MLRNSFIFVLGATAWFYSVVAAADATTDFIAGLVAYDKKDYASALKWYRKAAEQGHAGAQSNLGIMYAHGQGVPQDHAEAVKWYREAAAHGEANAQFRLGVMYDDGHGVPQDYVEAVKWYRKAAKQEHAGAEGNLGVMYALGQGVPQDRVMAHAWLSLAAAQGIATAGRLRDLIAGEMQPAQIAEAQALAKKWSSRNTP
ncbi:MAG: tetratricopeptide repeat protein [Pseudomonadota bacterium]